MRFPMHVFKNALLILQELVLPWLVFLHGFLVKRGLKGPLLNSMQ